MAKKRIRKYVGDLTQTKKALAFAIRKHDGQFRRVSHLPYIVHVVQVFAIVYKYKESVNIDLLGAIAILHDTIEDTDTTYEELLEIFGPIIANTVLELTNDPDEIRHIGKQNYIDQKLLGLSSYGLVVKIADMLANVGENPLKKTVRRIAHHRRFLLSSGRHLSATHLALLDELGYTLRTLYNIE